MNGKMWCRRHRRNYKRRCPLCEEETIRDPWHTASALSDENILIVWDALWTQKWASSTIWQGSYTMDEWAEAVWEELGRRNLNKNRV